MKAFWRKLTGRPGQAWGWLRAKAQRLWAAIRQKLTGTTTRTISTLVVATLIIAIPLLVFVPQGQAAHIADDATRLEREDNARRTLAQIMAGAVGLMVIWITWRRLQVAQEGQVTERFSRAIDHLGNDSLDVRLGAIYALERIARDSSQDHGPIMEILTAYVREHARREPPPEDQQPAANTTHPATDIQAVLTIIGRRKTDYDPPGQRLDLRNTDLHGANLTDANLQGANFNVADLQGALLDRAKLQGVHFINANLHGAHFDDADLQGAFFLLADLTWGEFSKAKGLTSQEIAASCGDDTTKLPPGVERPAHWPAEREDAG